MQNAAPLAYRFASSHLIQRLEREIATAAVSHH
jgi:hypothetical protein